MKRTCRSERVPQGVSSVQGEGREALPAHVTTCATAPPSPASEGPKLTVYVAPQSAAQQPLCCHRMTTLVNPRWRHMPGQEHIMHNADQPAWIAARLASLVEPQARRLVSRLAGPSNKPVWQDSPSTAAKCSAPSGRPGHCNSCFTPAKCQQRLCFSLCWSY